MRLNGVNRDSSIYGFGVTYTIWTQGCTLNCPGCWNKHMHDPKGGYEITIDNLVEDIQSSIIRYNVSEIAILGGEPLQQLASVVELMKRVKALGLGIILYTGYERDEIDSSSKKQVLDYADLLIAGRYKKEQRNITNHLYGSENQTIEYLTDRYNPKDIYNGTYVEIEINEDASMNVYGYPDDFVGGINA